MVPEGRLFSKNFTFLFKRIYKKIINPLWVTHQGDYGFYQQEEDHNLFFYDQPFADFYLTNASFEKEPFYAQALFAVRGGVPGKWIFYFSFLAHMGMGNTVFGNGPGANDIGLIDETMANPNSRINSFGRLDGDRGYMAKLYFGFYWFKNLFMGVSLKYRDGNPFAFFEYLNDHEQWVIYYQTIKAEDERGVKGGPREDYLSDISIKFSYKIRFLNNDMILGLSIFNLLDFGQELSEYTFSGGTRDAIELQIPRSLRFTITYSF